VVEQKKSGNPGYLDGYPLKIGFLAATVIDGAPVSVYQDGFEVSGGDSAGKCIITPTSDTATQVTDF